MVGSELLRSGVEIKFWQSESSMRSGFALSLRLRDHFDFKEVRKSAIADAAKQLAQHNEVFELLH
jgi:hypothetical protein